MKKVFLSMALTGLVAAGFTTYAQDQDKKDKQPAQAETVSNEAQAKPEAAQQLSNQDAQAADNKEQAKEFEPAAQPAQTEQAPPAADTNVPQ